VFDPARFYSATEVWRGSHAPRALVYEALESGELPAIRRGTSGTRWLIPGRSAIRWIESLGGGSHGEAE
jgi:hypothetical protein